MSLLARLSRQTIRVGSSTACEIHVEGPGVAPVHAEVIHQGGGKVTLVPSAAGDTFIKGQKLAPGQATPFDFRTPFHLGEVPLPLTHPDLCLMFMSRGFLPIQGKELVVGRDPERCHLVLSSPGVSGAHATLQLDGPAKVRDDGSTSGTWLDGKRVAAGEAVPVDDEAIVALGPLPLPIGLARALLAEFDVAPKEAPAYIARTQAMAQRTEERRAMPSRLPSLPAERHRTVMGTVKMAGARSHSVGRKSDCDIVLDYPQISAHHANLLLVGEQVFLSDAASELGTSVRGSRIKPGQQARVSDGERVHFGPLQAIIKIEGESIEVLVEDQEDWAGRPLFDIAASHVSVQVPDRDNPSQTKTLLDNVSFKALPGDLVALMGPSGSGKTTLLHALTGYLRPSSGQVLVNSSPLPDVFESLRGSIGYVPQDDIIHPELTVYEAVRYSARFRLPADYTEEEIRSRVSSTLAQLGLDSVAHLQIGRPEHKVLSGGQRKRVNIAMELVTDPVLLYLDEPTSGLAADDTTALVDLLARLAQDQGKTIVATIHQPARDEYEKFNLALVLGHGGIPIYFGATEEAYAFFEAWRGPQEVRGLNTPRDMFAELSEREARLRELHPNESRQDVRELVSREYEKEYQKSEALRTITGASRVVDEQKGSNSAELPRRERPRGQLRLLLSRYTKIKVRDRVGTAILLLQAPIIGVLLSLVFGASKASVPYWCLGALNELSGRMGNEAALGENLLSRLQPASDHAGALFFLVVAAVWFGTSNASREIVSERAIFRRERMVNLGVGNYIFSKFAVLSALCVVQCTVLLTIVFLSLGLAGGSTAFLVSLGTMILTALCSVALGLLLSAVVASSEAAMALTPLALIPQVVLGGLMVPVTTNALLKVPMMVVPARWGFEGVVRQERLARTMDPGWQIPLPEVKDSLPDFIENGAFQCAAAQLESGILRGAWGFQSSPFTPALVLSAMTGALLLLVALLLRRRS